MGERVIVSFDLETTVIENSNASETMSPAFTEPTPGSRNKIIGPNRTKKGSKYVARIGEVIASNTARPIDVTPTTETALLKGSRVNTTASTTQDNAHSLLSRESNSRLNLISTLFFSTNNYKRLIQERFSIH